MLSKIGALAGEAVMDQNHETGSRKNARVLLYSQRNIYDPEVWRASFHEFEGLLQLFDAVDMVALDRARYHIFRKNHAQRIGKYTTIPINAGVRKGRLEQDYDLFLAIIEKPTELLNINALRGWRDRCKTAICWMAEIWIKDIPTHGAELRVLSKFDHALFNVARSVEPISRRIKSQCHYLPAGVDALAFCPYPERAERFIDIMSIGRRSQKTHEVLLRMAREQDLFYYYDTQSDMRTYDVGQHRFLMSNLAKRSRYFIVNPGKIDSIDETAGQVEFGYRYFEGAAAGTIMIGEDPGSEEFRQFFPWPDAVVHLPFDSEAIDETLRQLNLQPERRAHIRKTNILNSLKLHDWVYRWERVLDLAGLDPLPMVDERKQELARMSDRVEQDTGCDG